MNDRRKLLVILVLIVFGVGVLFAVRTSKTGTLKIYFSTPDQDNLSVLIDQKKIAITGPQTSLETKAGTHILSVKKPGYQSVKITFIVNPGHVTLISVPLKRTSEPLLNSWQEVVGLNATMAQATLKKTVYFYDNSWAFVTIELYGNPGNAVVKYDDSAGAWKLALQPGTLFTTDSVRDLPPQVADYLRAGGYVESGNRS